MKTIDHHSKQSHEREDTSMVSRNGRRRSNIRLQIPWDNTNDQNNCPFQDDNNAGYRDHSFHAMPPPKKVFHRGSDELRDAMNNKEVVLSLPDQGSIEAWMDDRTGRPTVPVSTTRRQAASHKKKEKKVRILSTKCTLSPRLVTLQREQSIYRGSQYNSNLCSSSWSNLYGPDGPEDPTLKETNDDRNDESVKVLPVTNHEQERDSFSMVRGKNYCPMEAKGEEEEEEIINNDSHDISKISENPLVTNNDNNNDYTEIDSFDDEEYYNGDVYMARPSNPFGKKRGRAGGNINGVTSVANSRNRKRGQGSTPSIRFEHIIGHQSAKLRLDEILIPLELPMELTQSILHGIRSLPASILLHGPPGTGKTSLAKATAGEANAAFLPVGPSDILSKYVGESESAVRNIFSKAVQMAREVESKLAVLFFDEIDALGQSRGISDDNGGGRSPARSPGTTQDNRGMDACSRRVLAELLIQLTRINDTYGNLTEEEDHDSSTCENSCQAGSEHFAGKTSIHDKDAGQYDNDDFEYDDEDCGEVRYNAQEVLDDEENQADRLSISSHDSTAVKRSKPFRVLVLAATNRPEDCDPALIRRFAVQIKVGIPREKDRIAMLKRHLDGVDHTLTENDFKKLGSVLDGFSGSDLESLSRDAAMAPVRECIRGAVMMKRRRIGGSSRHGSEQGTVDETFRASQQHLLEELSSLRPVNFQDFVISLKFWASRTTSQVGVDTPNSPLAKLGIQVTNVEEHYNSSSDEDNERF